MNPHQVHLLELDLLQVEHTDKQSTDGIVTSSQPSTRETASESTTSTSDPIEKHDHMSTNGHDGNSPHASALSMIASKQKMQSQRFSSVIWKLVTLQEDCQTCVCNICKLQLVYNKKSTYNLLVHLRLKHPLEYAVERELQTKEEKQSEEEKLSELVDTYKYYNDDTQSTVRVATDKQFADGISTSSQPSAPKTTSESTPSTSDPIEKHDHISAIGHDGNASVRSTPSLSTIALKQKRQSKIFPSICWKLVTLQEDGQTCVCNICKFELVYDKKSTTNLLRHIRFKHPIECAVEEKKSKKEKLSRLKMIASKQKRHNKRFWSVCWKLFTLQEDCQTCVCNICKLELVYNEKSNFNLLRHIRLKHPIEEKQSEEEKLSELVDTYKYYK